MAFGAAVFERDPARTPRVTNGGAMRSERDILSFTGRHVRRLRRDGDTSRGEDAADEPRGESDGTSRLRVVSLFAGIGGFDCAFESIEASVVAQCEIDPFCQAVLRRHWPNATILGNISEVSVADLPDADVWTAGFPCQDVSLARGNHGRSGLKGDHTSLFFRLVELVEEKRPQIILLENVVGLLNSHKGCDFAIILNELVKHGYAVSWRVLNARYFGTPQSRSRVFMVAWLGDFQRALASLFEPVAGARPGTERSGFLTPTRHEPTGAIVPETAYCVAATSGRHTGNDWSRSYVSYEDRIRRPTASESERLQGFPAGWTIPTADYRAPARGLDSERYRAIGNAVAVPVAKWIARRISRAWQLPEERDCGLGFETQVLRDAPDFKASTATLTVDQVMREVEEGTFAYRWKGCGIAWNGAIVEGASAPAPCQIVTSRFVDLLDSEVPDERYFLTPNAAAGMLRRADTVGRTFFGPMRAALETVVKNAAPATHTSRSSGGEKVAKIRICPAGSVERRDDVGFGPGNRRAVRVAS
jgi:DNA (cytosine-5)-methyltransferase 1